MRQVEVSRTLVLDDPRRARRFFEALVADNIGIGRPAEVHAVFGRDRRGRWRKVNSPELVALVRAGGQFTDGTLIERSEDQSRDAA